MAVSTKRRSDLSDDQTSKRAKVQTHDGAVKVQEKQNFSKDGSYSGKQGNAAEKETMKEKGKDGSETKTFHGSGKNGVQNYSKSKETFLSNQSSREAHAKQKAVAAERRAAKPNADSIARTKKIWERLRIKSAVPKAERDELVAELFSIITTRVKEFVFKHDSVRVIQCALKYSTPEQKKQIARELQGNYRELAESKYAKFLIAKLVVGDNEIRDLVVPEFYGHVKRLMRHPEASWIVDDIYRGLATKEQKAKLLREWYGPEFVMFSGKQGESTTAELSAILQESPEKRATIMQHLREMTNQLVQKKTTGFTMLHDALLQYFLNTKPGTPEAMEFLEMLRDDEDGDLYKNLAFTKSGSRLVCLALAYGNSKDRRNILKFFKTHIKLLSGDINGHLVLLAGYEVIDDTVMISKSIFPELLSKDQTDEERNAELLSQVSHLTARIPLLYLMQSEAPKWLITDEDLAMVKEIREIRKETSKKDSETRRAELLKSLSQPLLDLITSQVSTLIESSFGCQFIGEVLLGAIGDKEPALRALTEFAKADTEENAQRLVTSHAGRMLKTLVQGGHFDKTTKQIQLVEPPLKFHDGLFEVLKNVDGGIVSWATGPNAFAIVAMLEASDFGYHEELEAELRKGKSELERPPKDDKAANAGTRIILERIGAGMAATSSSAPLSHRPHKSKKTQSK